MFKHLLPTFKLTEEVLEGGSAGGSEAPAVEVAAGDLPVESVEESALSVSEDDQSSSGEPVETPAAPIAGVTDKPPAAETVDYKTQYTATAQKLNENTQVLNYVVKMVQEGNVAELAKVFGVQQVPAAPAEPVVNPFNQFIEEQTPEAFQAAVAAAAGPMIAEKDKQIQNYQQQLSFLMNQEANRSVETLRKDIPGFKDYEPKVAEIMRKYSGISAKEAHILASHENNKVQMKKDAVAEYIKSVQAKKVPSDVLQPGDISNTTEKTPAFANFTEAYNYTKGKMSG